MDKSEREDIYKDYLITYTVSRLENKKFNGGYLIKWKDGNSIPSDDNVGQSFTDVAGEYYNSEEALLDALFIKAKQCIDMVIEKKS